MTTMRAAAIGVVGVLSFLAMDVSAQTASPLPSPAPPEDAESEGLLALLSEETAVATRTKMNGDFVPGIVTVLHGDELEALGFETVGEALALVPGVQAVRDFSGTPSVIVRGVDFPFNSGNVKVLLNSVPLSRESAGINGVVLQTPVQQVERIEIIRGPGSAVYGDFAFMGLVNIVTRQQGTRLFLRGGGDDAVSGGATLSWKDAEGKTEVSLGAAGWTSDDAPVAAPRVAEEDRGWATLAFRRGDFRLTAQGVTRDLREAATPTAAASTNEQTHWTVEARFGRDLSPSLRSELRASFLDNRFEAPFLGFEGNVSDLGLELQWNGWRRHSWLFAVGYSLSDIDEAFQRLPAPPPPPPGAPPLPPLPDIRIRDEERRGFSATLQDRVSLSDAVAVTAGARFDDYSDVGSRVTPRLSLVWRASERNILKLQHAEGFRAPTFFELYASNRRNPDLAFEVNATTELNYVHRRPRTVVRATVFRTRIRDMVFVRRPGLFDNSREARAHGAELEWEQQLGERLKLQANASWANEEDDRNLSEVIRPTAPAADWLGNLALLWRPTSRSLFSARFSHVGERHASSQPAGYDLVDLAVTRHDLFVRGLRLRAGVKNVLDSDVRYIVALPGFEAALPFPGRTFWAQLGFSR